MHTKVSNKETEAKTKSTKRQNKMGVQPSLRVIYLHEQQQGSKGLLLADHTPRLQQC